MSGIRADAAFPLVVQRPGEVLIQPGMTLRDWFAGQALVQCSDWDAPDEAARHAYRVADAMLKARQT